MLLKYSSRTWKRTNDKYILWLQHKRKLFLRYRNVIRHNNISAILCLATYEAKQVVTEAYLQLIYNQSSRYAVCLSYEIILLSSYEYLIYLFWVSVLWNHVLIALKFMLNCIKSHTASATATAHTTVHTPHSESHSHKNSESILNRWTIQIQ